MIQSAASSCIATGLKSEHGKAIEAEGLALELSASSSTGYAGVSRTGKKGKPFEAAMYGASGRHTFRARFSNVVDAAVCRAKLALSVNAAEAWAAACNRPADEARAAIRVMRRGRGRKGRGKGWGPPLGRAPRAAHGAGHLGLRFVCCAALALAQQPRCRDGSPRRPACGLLGSHRALLRSQVGDHTRAVDQKVIAALRLLRNKPVDRMRDIDVREHASAHSVDLRTLDEKRLVSRHPAPGTGTVMQVLGREVLNG